MVLDLKIPASEVALNFPKGLSNEAFETLCLENKELLIEREANGTITVMTPVSFTSGDHEADFIADLKIYARKYGGKALSSATGFTLPDTSIKSPDASYVSQDKVSAVSEDQLRRFP
ncbi:MAG: Uma2 family endonuclease, partial [Bacteroidota bacterium]